MEDSQSRLRVCVFCGGKPARKTKEHVVPRWLIELTGDPARMMNLSPIEGFPTQLPYQNFSFPACKKCNGRYSILEAETQNIFGKLLAGDGITGTEASTLLDWFDKVRVGLWLGSCMLTKNAIGIKPRFSISSRIAGADRLLLIGKTTEESLRLNIGHITDPVFVTTPSFFGLYVNGLAFVSLSYTHCVAKRLGLPYLFITKQEWIGELPVATVELMDESVSNYGRDFPIIRPGFTLLAQAIPHSITAPLPIEYQEKYRSKGVSPEIPSAVHVFIDGVGRILSDNPTSVLHPTRFTSRDRLRKELSELCMLARNWVAQRLPEPQPGKPFTCADMVAVMERGAPGSSIWFGEEIAEIAKFYVEVMWGRKTHAEWDVFMSQQFENAQRKYDHYT